MGAHAGLAGDWELWRDFAVCSAGFPVAGLDVFGPDGNRYVAELRLVAVDRTRGQRASG